MHLPAKIRSSVLAGHLLAAAACSFAQDITIFALQGKLVRGS